MLLNIGKIKIYYILKHQYEKENTRIICNADNLIFFKNNIMETYNIV